jgi:dihydrofolate reductase
MNNPVISIIAAISENRGLGKNNKLLWHIHKDMQRFKNLTISHPVIMGRKTYESIGMPLSQRINIIISKDEKYFSPGCYVVHSMIDAINFAKINEKKEIFIIGGGQIYSQGIEFADRLYLTVVKGRYSADTFFPDYSDFKSVVSKVSDYEEKYEFEFVVLERKLS